MQQAPTFKLSWFRRLRNKLFAPKALTAGDRPRSRRRAIGGSGRGWLSSWVIKVVALLIVAFVVLAMVGPWKAKIRSHLSGYYHDAVNVVHPTYNPVHPVSAVASSTAPGHAAELAIDGSSNTSWQTNSPNNGVGQSLTVHLGTPTNIDKIGFLIGDTDTPQAYVSEPRPETIHLVFTPPAASGSAPYSTDITLKDSAAFQTFTVHAKNASTLSISISSVYPSTQGGTHASLTEVELFKRS